MRILTGVFLIFFFTTIFAQDAVERIRVNQIGYYPNGPKVAVVVDPPGTEFTLIRTDDGTTVFTGTLSAPKIWSYSKENVSLADFSAFADSGSFRVHVEGVGDSWPFGITPFVHQRVAVAAVKSYYYQRASMALDETWAGPWKRKEGHPDTLVYIHPSAATENRPANTIIQSPKGWYDAGDYNKYIVNSGISTWTILATYEHFPEYCTHLKSFIPETGNDIPDILDEALWNLRWMLTMQDPDDGGVYHKLTCANFEGFVMPDRARSKRYVVAKSVTATLDFAAVMAQAARIFQKFATELPGLADSCLSAAEAAWDWAQDNPTALYRQSTLNSQFNPDINTGEYGDGNASDEFLWAGLELYLTTGDSAYLENPFSNPAIRVPSWPNVSTLGVISLLLHPDRVGPGINLESLRTDFLAFANTLVSRWQSSAYGVVMGAGSNDFGWGSNGVTANQALCLLVANSLTQGKEYLDAAVSNLDYCLGRNATGYSFVTGHGDKTPMKIHHRPSGSDGVKDPVPGLLAGGPNPGQQDGVSYPSKLPAKSYVDNQNSYASNEICINWNAPLVYIAFGIESILSESGLPQDQTGVASETKSVSKFQLVGNYPNPFNPSTMIQFALSKAGRIKLTVYDLLGRTVAHPVDGVQFTAGLHEVAFEANNLSSGIYVVRLESEGQCQTRKMMLLK